MNDKAMGALEKRLRGQFPVVSDEGFLAIVQARLSRRRLLRLSVICAAWLAGIGTCVAGWGAFDFSGGAVVLAATERVVATHHSIELGLLLVLYVIGFAWLTYRSTS